MSLIKSLKYLVSICLIAVTVEAQPANIAIPELGVAGVRGLTVQAERNYGDYFKRKALGAGIFSFDPVLNEYISSVGNRLVIHAHDVYFPFEFFLSPDTSINACAFLGGKVQVNAGLFHYTKTEDEFASVLAHEISHVTQRHIARFIESQSQKNSLNVASIIGSVVLAIINPEVGMAALSSATGMMAQSNINFTRDNEYEADRVGLSLLYDSGYNPMAMSDLFRTMLAKQGNINSAYALLIDHPLSEIRVSEAYNRAKNLPKRNNSTNPNFMFAKARVDVRYMNLKINELKERIEKNSKVNKYYKNYALALIAFENKNFSEATTYLDNIAMPNNDFVLDLKTDIDIAKGQFASATSRLSALYQERPNDTVISINLANAYIESKQNQKAISILKKILQKDSNNTLASDMLTKAYFAVNDKCNAYQVAAQNSITKGKYNQANNLLTSALRNCTGNSREIVRAKFKMYSDIRSFDENIEKNH